MKLTDKEVSHLDEVIRDCRLRIQEAGGSTVVVLASFESEASGWDMTWGHIGDPYAAMELTRRFRMLDANRSLGKTIAENMDSDDGEAWKE